MVRLMSPTLLLTRPEESADSFAIAARAQGWRGGIVSAPLMRIEGRVLDRAMIETAGSWVATSQHAITILARTSPRRDTPLYCVGPRTAQEARAQGFGDVHQAGGDGAALLADLLASPPPAPILHLHGAHLAVDLAARLSDAGFQAASVVAYDQVACPLSGAARAVLAGAGDVVVALFSPRTAQLFAQECREMGPIRAKLHILALSAKVAAALGDGPFARVTVAAQPDGKALLDDLLHLQAALEAGGNPR
jgi:uroporphyrinogen-III synthase